MIVVSIIAVLASIAVPKFSEFIRKTKEGASKANLGVLRSALKIYYSQMDGEYPSTLAVLTVGGRYIDAIPLAKAPNFHTETAALALAVDSDDAAGWIYNNSPQDANFSSLAVNCTHTDSKGSVWTLY